MDPIEGGDIHLVPLNMQSLEFAGEKPKEPAAPAKSPASPADAKADETMNMTWRKSDWGEPR
jgi:hypothetical protein